MAERMTLDEIKAIDVGPTAREVAAKEGVDLSSELSSKIAKEILRLDTRKNPKVFWNQRLRKAPWHDGTRMSGAESYATYNGGWIPYHYDSPENEFWCLTNHVTVWDVGAAEQIIQVEGPDAEPFMEYLIPRRMDMEKVGAMRCAYVILCDDAGGVLNDPVLVRLSKNKFWLALADNPMFEMIKAIRDLKGFNAMVTLPDVHAMQIQGPKSRLLMTKLFDESADAIREMKYYDALEAQLAGKIPTVIGSTGWTTELGYEIYLQDGSYGNELWDRVLEAGEEFEVAPICPILGSKSL